jgi:hypothetical protein
VEIGTDKKNLLALVDKAQSGEIALPQFQRNFVWTRDDLQDLLLSILKGYFIGSFVLLRTDQDTMPFAPRPIAGVELSGADPAPEWMILDGQQRLTSLHYAFTAPSIPLKWTKYPYRFFLDLAKIAEGDLDNAIWSTRSDHCDQYDDKAKQFETMTLPFTQIPTWDGWQMEYELWLVEANPESLQDHVRNVKPVWTEALNVLRQFMVPIVEVPKVRADDPEGIAEVCAIFEKMNSTGVPLSVYDLLTARLYIYGIDLHALWQEALERHSALAEFSGGEPDAYGVFALRIIALMRGHEVKSKTLINLSPEQFVEDWRVAAEWLDKALRRMSSTADGGFGVFDQKWIPYSTMISVLAALLWRIQRDRRGHPAYEAVRRWYWGSVFLERYAGAVESTAYSDYLDIARVFEDPQHQPAVFIEAADSLVNNESYSIRDVARRNAVYRGVMNLVALRGAKDFRTGDAIEFHLLDDHHIFPRAYLRKAGGADGEQQYSDGDINTIVNRTLISSETNRKISRSKPATYFEKVIPRGKAADIMSSHFIDEAATDAMLNNDYDAFVEHRERCVLERIRALVS